MVNAENNRSMGNTRIRRLLSESSFVAKLSTFIAAPEWCSPEGRRSQYRDMEGSLRPRLGLISWKQVCLMRYDGSDMASEDSVVVDYNATVGYQEFLTDGDDYNISVHFCISPLVPRKHVLDSSAPFTELDESRLYFLVCNPHKGWVPDQHGVFSRAVLPLAS